MSDSAASERIGLILARTPWNRRVVSGVNAAMKRTVPSLLGIIVVLAACSASGGAPPSSAGESTSPPSQEGEQGEIEHPAGAEPVLVVEDVGGFVMVDMLATRLPGFVMLGDGRVIMQGMQTLEFPGPALRALMVRTLTESGVQEVLAAVEATNLFTGDLELRGASNFVADATDTVFTLNAGGREATVSVYGLGLLDPSMGNPQGVTSGEIQAHEILSRLRDSLMAIDTEVSADGWETEGWQPYEAEAFRLYVRDVTGEPADGDLPGQVRQWPTEEDPALFGEPQPGMSDGTRCGVVEGDLAQTWLAELNQANQNTTWTDGTERRFRVQARPLLPGDEPTCPELFGA